MRFGSAAGGRRSEDGPLLTGRGRFTDDVDLPGQAHAAFVRAPGRPRPHSRRGRRRALAAAGRARGPHGRGASRRGSAHPARRRLPGPRRQADARRSDAAARASDRVRYVGEAVAIVVAETAAQAPTPRKRCGSSLDAARGRRRRPRPGRRRAPDLARGAGQRRPRLEDGDAAAVDAAFARGRASRAGAPARHAAGAVRAGAARGDRPVGRGDRALHPHRLHAGRGGRAPAPGRGRVQGPAGAAPRDHATTWAAASA